MHGKKSLLTHTLLLPVTASYRTIRERPFIPDYLESRNETNTYQCGSTQ